MMTCRLTDCAVGLAAGVVLLALGASGRARAQEPSPVRDSLRVQVAAREAEIAAAAAVFLDKQRPEAERAAAVARITAFVRPDDIRRAFALARDQEEPPQLRAFALPRVQHALAGDTGFAGAVLALVVSATTPGPIRDAAMEVLETLMFGSAARHARHDDFVAVLRLVTQDPDSNLRARAFALLVADGDEQTRRQLLESLRQPELVPLPPASIVRLLGLTLTDSVYPVLHAVLIQPPDAATRVEAIRLLGGYVPSRLLLTRYLQDAQEPDVVRLAAMATLHANAPGEFPGLALPVILDEQASDSLRLYGIQATRLRRRTLGADSLAAFPTGDSFDQAMLRLATESRSTAVRAAAASYLRARGVSHRP